MPRRKRATVQARNEQPPEQLPTVWDTWSPAPDGPAVQGLRALFVVMDAHLAQAQDGTDATPEQLELLARVMWAAYTTASDERRQEAMTGAGE